MNSAAKLLVVDDDQPVRESIVGYLADSGYDVLEADDGELALALVVSEQPDLVITDLRMPALDGHGVLDALQVRDVPVIVMSGFGEKEDVVQALRLGASDYLTKPILDLGMLEIAIERALERARLVRQNQIYATDLERVNDKLKQQLKILEQDQIAGRRVQTKILPKSPMTLGNYHIEHQIIPSLYLSGDMIDYFVIRDRFLVFFLADVSGHGASSAFVTILIHHIATNMHRQSRDFDNRSLMRQLTPANILMNINDELLSVDLDKHVACFLGVIDMRSNKLYYSVAGQYPMPVITQDDEVMVLPGEGMPLGIMANAVYREYDIEVKSNFKLLVCSDGLFEVDNSDSLEAKMANLVSRANESKCDVAALLKSYGVETHQQREDDIAVLSISSQGE